MRALDDGTGSSLEPGGEDATVGLQDPHIPDDPQDVEPSADEEFAQQTPEFYDTDEPIAEYAAPEPAPRADDLESEDELFAEDLAPEPQPQDQEPIATDPPADAMPAFDETDLLRQQLEAERARSQAAWAAHDRLSGRQGQMNQEMERLRQASLQPPQAPPPADDPYADPQRPQAAPPMADPRIDEIVQRQRATDEATRQREVDQAYRSAIQQFDTDLQARFGVAAQDAPAEAIQAYQRCVAGMQEHARQRQADLIRAARTGDPNVMRAETQAILSAGLVETMAQNVRRAQAAQQQVVQRQRRRRDLASSPTAGATRQRRPRPQLPTAQADIDKMSPAQLEAAMRAMGRKGF